MDAQAVGAQGLFQSPGAQRHDVADAAGPQLGEGSGRLAPHPFEAAHRQRRQEGRLLALRDAPQALAAPLLRGEADYAKGVVDPSYIENPRLLMWGLEYSW